MRKLRPFIFFVGVVIFSTISNSSASALFGSECNKPKASYTNQITEAKSLRKAAYAVSARDKAAHYAEQTKRAEESFKTCLRNKLLTTSECKALNELAKKPSKMPLFYQGKLTESNLKFDTAYRIVLNNQKCFDPIVVVEAQRYLGK